MKASYSIITEIIQTDDPLQLFDPPCDKVKNKYEGQSQTLIIFVDCKYNRDDGSPEQEEQSDGQDETEVE